MELNKFIDHTLLKPDASEADIRKLCAEAAEYHFAAAFVNPYWVKLTAELLKDTGVRTGVAIAFPLGAFTTETKVFQVREAIASGADEPDMVINIGAVKSGNWNAVETEIAAVVAVARPLGVKVILETCLLTDAEKVRAALIAKQAGAAFVKTSTGFSTGGATVEDVKLLRQTVGADMGVKASGGIRRYATVKAMIDAGANRIGTSAGPEIVKDYLASFGR
jgi:deoxyribose-phosphate aldolase